MPPYVYTPASIATLDVSTSAENTLTAVCSLEDGVNAVITFMLERSSKTTNSCSNKGKSFPGLDDET
jgi:hypothetical protein